MKYLIDSGLAEGIRRFYANGGTVYGLCGGYQMMGEKIDDSHLRDNDKIPEIEGLGLLPAVTTFGEEKTVSRRRGRAIHPYYASRGFTHYAPSRGDAELRAAGSYLHNAFHNDRFRAAWLNALRRRRGLPEREPVSTTAAKEAAYDALAAHARKNLDIDYIVKISGVK